jgi:hypothetical protein
MGQTVNLLINFFGGSNPSVPTKGQNFLSGSSSVGRASAFQAEGRGFESRLPLLKNETFAKGFKGLQILSLKLM